jgi:dienelactone hydrolase
MAVAVGACVIVAAVAFVAAGLALFGGSDDDAGSSGTATTTTATTVAPGTTSAPATTTAPTTAPPTTTAATSAAIGRTYPVGTRSVTFVDPSRSTSPNGGFAGAPNRTLPTQFWYPAQDDGETPARGDGPYPLVVFSHGYDVTPDFYAPLLERWAAAGYVVAAPTYPILSGDDGGASHVDYERTFADTSFVISQVLALGNDDPLAGMVDPDRIAAAGHSDGEVVSFGVGFLECCRDARVKSVIAMAGDLSNANNPHVRDTGTPILHIMEVNDEYDPYPHSIQWDRDNLTAPRWMVSLNSSHVPPYTQPGDPAFELVSTISVAYLDGTLKGHPERLDEMVADVAAQPAVGSIER